MLGGEAVAKKLGLWGLRPGEVDARVVELVKAGRVPSWQGREWCPVTREHEGRRMQFWVSPDYVSVGDDEGWLRMPLCPAAAQAVLDVYGALLPSAVMARAIMVQGDVKLWKHAFGSPRDTIERTVQSNDAIEADRQGQWGLVTGHKKDIVVTARRQEDRLVIWGWRDRKGSDDIVQPENATSHSVFYKDYSHGVRLVRPDVLVNGQQKTLVEVMRDQALCELVSDRGPIILRMRYVPRDVRGVDDAKVQK